MSCEVRTYFVEDLIKSGYLEIGDGYRAKNSELSESGIPFARAGNINDGFKFEDADYFPESELPRVGSKISRPGDVVFTSKGTVGRFALVNEHSPRFVYSPQLCYWRSLDTEVIYPEYLYYWMNSKEFLQQIGYLKGQTDMADYVSLRDQRRMTLTIPPFARQLEVSGCLALLDDRITLLRETNATLEAIAQALFKSWFVDFDPVRAKMEGRQPEGMDEETAALFPDGFEESELGLVPRGWKLGTLGQIAHTKRNQLQPQGMDSDLNYVGLEHIPRKSLSLHNWGKADDLKSAKLCFEQGNILFGKLRPYFHKVVIAPMSGVCSTDILVCQANDKNYYGPVALHLFSDALIKHADRLSNGAKMPRVSWKDLEGYTITIPPVEIAAAFTRVFESLAEVMKNNLHRTHTLSALRDTLLPRLISGRLSLPTEVRPMTIAKPT